MSDLKLGVQLGYWGAQPSPNTIETAQQAEQLGFDSVWTAEAWGSDAFTPLAWIGAHTSKIRLGTSVVQLSARTPTATAMAALTLDHLSGGRMILGLGVSGPQVVEGWYGQPFSKPLSRTREYIGIIRQVLAREDPVSSDGPHYPLPYKGEGSWNLGKSLRSITHPLRADLPIFMGAEGPKNVALAAEIADGWLPLGFVPGSLPEYLPWLEAGFARAGNGKSLDNFEIAALVQVTVNGDVQAALDAQKPNVALYVGGMGHKDKNFHKDLMIRRGYGDAAQRIQELFLAGHKGEAAAAVPDEWVDQRSLVGPPARIRERYRPWADSGATGLAIWADQDEAIEVMADAAGFNR